MGCQGYDVDKNVLYQDNKSTILLENNSKKISSKQTRALKIRYFFLTEQIEKVNLSMSIAQPWIWLATLCQKSYKEKCFKSSISWLWDTNMFRHKMPRWQERVGRPEYLMENQEMIILDLYDWYMKIQVTIILYISC